MKNLLYEYILILQEAGDLLRQRFYHEFYFDDLVSDDNHHHIKGKLKDSHELLLDVDLLSQKILVTGIQRLFPDCGIYSEEMDNWHEFHTDKRFKFVIDPLDGTHNYYFGIPQWGISVAFLDPLNNPLIGYIYIPFFDILLTNLNGQTMLYHKGQRQRIKNYKKKSLAEGIVAYDNQFYRLGDEAFEYYRRIVKSTFTTRISGSAAFDTAMVVLGRFDARVWNKVEIYDIAATFSLIKEVGGTLCDFSGNKNVTVCNKQIIISRNDHFAYQLAHLSLLDTKHEC